MTLRRSAASPWRASWALLLVAPACLYAELRLGGPLSQGELAPGQTREQALDLMGPPDDFYADRAFDRLRSYLPAERPPLGDARDARADGLLTWTREVQHSRAIWILPFVTLFSHLDEVHSADRTVALLDAQGRIVAVTRQARR